jgi:O-antigen/teichoic acid export membrane protein
MFQTIVKKSAAFSVQMLALRFLGIALLPLYTRMLTPSDYGILELLDLTLSFFTTLFGAQLSSALYYQYASAKEHERGRVLSTALIGSLLVGISAAGIGVASSTWIGRAVFRSDAYTAALRLYFVTLAFNIFVETGFGQLRAVERIRAWNMRAIVRAVILAILNIAFLVYWRLGYYSILWSSLLTNALVAVWMAWDFYKDSPIVLDLTIFRKMARYSAPLGVAGVAMLFIHYGDRFFLQRSVSLAEVGMYALAYKIGMTLTSSIHGPFVSYWSMEMFHVAQREDGDSYYARVFTYLVLVLAVGGTLIVVFSQPAIEILAAPAYWPAAAYVPWLTFAYVVRSLGDHLRTPLLTEAKTGLNTKVTIAGFIVTITAYAILIPRYRVWGAVAATVIAFVTMFGYSFLASQRVRRYPFEYGRLAKLCIVLAVCCLPPTLAHLDRFLAQMILGTVCAAAIPAGLYLTRFFTESEREAIQRTTESALRSVGWSAKAA